MRSDAVQQRRQDAACNLAGLQRTGRIVPARDPVERARQRECRQPDIPRPDAAVARAVGDDTANELVDFAFEHAKSGATFGRHFMVGGACVMQMPKSMVMMIA